MKTATEFDAWIAKKRQRHTGPCTECGRDKELRQLEPEPLCGACLEKLRRKEAIENDPITARKDSKKLQKRIRTEMNKVLNVVDALEGLVDEEHLNQIERVAKLYLKPIIGGPDGDGHGHGENERDHDQGLKPAALDSDLDAGPAREQTSNDAVVDDDNHSHHESEGDRDLKSTTFEVVAYTLPKKGKAKDRFTAEFLRSLKIGHVVDLWFDELCTPHWESGFEIVAIKLQGGKRGSPVKGTITVQHPMSELGVSEEQKLEVTEGQDQFIQRPEKCEGAAIVKDNPKGENVKFGTCDKPAMHVVIMSDGTPRYACSEYGHVVAHGAPSPHGNL